LGRLGEKNKAAAPQTKKIKGGLWGEDIFRTAGQRNRGAKPSANFGTGPEKRKKSKRGAPEPNKGLLTRVGVGELLRIVQKRGFPKDNRLKAGEAKSH